MNIRSRRSDFQVREGHAQRPRLISGQPTITFKREHYREALICMSKPQLVDVMPNVLTKSCRSAGPAACTHPA